MKKKIVVSKFITWHELDSEQRKLARPLIQDLIQSLDIAGFGWDRKFLSETKSLEIFKQCYTEVYGFDKRVTEIRKLNWSN